MQAALIEVKQLVEILYDPGLVIIDCRYDPYNIDAGFEQYKTGHIPGAYHVHVKHDLSAIATGENGRHPLPDKKQFDHLLAQLGVYEANTIVLYDAKYNIYSARLWWMLSWFGIRHVYLLDGGYSFWQSNVGLSSTAVQEYKHNIVTATDYVANDDQWVDANDVLSQLETKHRLVVDARPKDRYTGKFDDQDPIAGHIPNAINHCYKNNHIEDGRFKSVSELSKQFTYLINGVEPHNVIHQCGSGITACNNLFCMELVKLPGSKLYPGSWSEWCADTSRPMVAAN